MMMMKKKEVEWEEENIDGFETREAHSQSRRKAGSQSRVVLDERSKIREDQEAEEEDGLGRKDKKMLSKHETDLEYWELDLESNM